MDSQESGFFLGTSGLVLPVPNKSYYPEEFKDKSRLQYYASMMNSIEVNSSFYKIPQARTIAKWCDEVPEDFKFTFKLFKGITHEKQLVFDAKVLEQFMQAIAPAANRKGALLVQFPPSVQESYLGRIESLLSHLRHLDADHQWDIAVELRHLSLYTEEMLDILERLGMILVLHDKLSSATTLNQPDSDARYFRFHGPHGNYRDSYDDQTLSDYAEMMRDWMTDGKRIYAYFNNTMGDALGNLKTLRNFVGGEF